MPERLPLPQVMLQAVASNAFAWTLVARVEAPDGRSRGRRFRWSS